MKVAMIGPSKYTEKGIAKYTEEHAEAIKRAGVDLDLITYKRGSFFSFLRIIPKAIKYDIIHIQHENRLFGPIDGIWYVPLIIFLGAFKRGRLVITFHSIHTKDEKILSLNSFFSWIKKVAIHPLHYALSNLFAEFIIVHTGFLKDDLIKNSRINRNKVIVIPHGAKPNVPIFDKVAAKKKLGLSGRVYLMIGHIGHTKGFDIILKQANKIGKNIVLVDGSIKKHGLAGAYLEKLYKIVKENKFEKFVKFDINDENARKLWWPYFSAADIVLMPYRQITTSGIFINAMEAGKPVVGCDCRYFREVLSKYDCITIVKNGDDYPRAIKHTLNKLSKMEEEAKRFATDNDINSIGIKYKTFYEAVNQKNK